MDEQMQLTKKQRRELRRQKKLQDRADRQSAKKRKSGLRWIITIVILLLAGYGVYSMIQSQSDVPLSDVDKIQTDDQIHGNPQAKVVLIEYGDFQCPACGSYYPIVKQLTEEYSDQIAFVYRHFPLRSVHKNAQEAAQAAEAAGVQGKFWEMHDKLFENQSEWSSEFGPKDIFVTYATSLGLDVEKFEQDYGSSAVEDEVDNDLERGNQKRINSTPSFVLNGKIIRNPQNIEQFRTLLDAEILNNPLPEQEDTEVHVHADFKVYLNGEAYDFSKSQYQSTKEKHTHEFIHLHGGNGEIIHRHAADITLGDLFRPFGINFTNACFEINSGEGGCTNDSNELVMYVNGEKNIDFDTYVIQDLDRILISYGPKDDPNIQKELDSITDAACIYSEKCPERGKPPTEECVGGLGTNCDGESNEE